MRIRDAAQMDMPTVVSTRPRRFQGQFSRVGVFPYVVNGKVIWQYRPEDEVLDAQSVESFYDAIITVDHPDDDGDFSQAHGAVYAVSVNAEKRLIEGEFLVVTREAEKLAKSKSQLSPMYDADIVEQAGVFEGMPYGYTQRNIRYTSLALVDQARQGDSIKVFYQVSKDGLIATPDQSLQYNTGIITMKNKIKDGVAAPSLPTAGVSEGSAAAAADETTITTIAQLEASLGLPALTEKPSESPSEAPEVAAEASVETPVENAQDDTTAEPVAAVDAVTDADADDAAAAADAEETTDLVALTAEGGILIKEAFLDDLMSVVEFAVANDVVSIRDGVFYGAANLDGLKVAVLDKLGVKLLSTDDVSTAYRVFLASYTPPKQDRVSSKAPTPAPATPVKTPVSSGKAPVKSPALPKMVTHPSTRATIGDSGAADTTVVPFDSIGI